jgi:nucleoid-associated protein YgaU
MLKSSSRYTTSSAPDGTVIAVRKPQSGESFTPYTVRDGDTLDLMAATLYGNPELYWRIADLNPHIPFPSDLGVGDVIRITQ